MYLLGESKQCNTLSLKNLGKIPLKKALLPKCYFEYTNKSDLNVLLNVNFFLKYEISIGG